VLLLDSLVSSSNDDDDKNDSKNISFQLGTETENDIVDDEDIVIEDTIVKTETCAPSLLISNTTSSSLFMLAELLVSEGGLILFSRLS
jgi:hypothetical protein